LGGGHLTAARAIQRHLEHTSPEKFEIRVSDLSANTFIHGYPVSRFIAWFYRVCITTFGSRPYRVLYRFADRRPAQVCRWALRLFGRSASAWLTSQRPDLVISTYPLVTCIASDAFRDTAVGVVSVITDAGRVNRLWWAGGADLLLATHQDVLTQASGAGIGPSRVRNIGLIVNPGLDAAVTPAQAKRRIGLRDRFTVLLASGGVGFGPNLERLAARIGRLAGGLGVQFLVATGHNSALRASIITALTPASAVVCPPADMSDELLAADLVIGKGGWLTISECITAGKPIIVVDSIPGQEDENIRLIESLGIGKRMSVDAAFTAFTTYAVHPELLARDFSARQELHDAHLGVHLANLITGMLDERRPTARSGCNDPFMPTGGGAGTLRHAPRAERRSRTGRRGSGSRRQAERP
jgi:processive 1,2-diacylglycerol beta-glucosyltransferase